MTLDIIRGVLKLIVPIFNHKIPKQLFYKIYKIFEKKNKQNKTTSVNLVMAAYKHYLTLSP